MSSVLSSYLTQRGSPHYPPTAMTTYHLDAIVFDQSQGLQLRRWDVLHRLTAQQVVDVTAIKVQDWDHAIDLLDSLGLDEATAGSLACGYLGERCELRRVCKRCGGDGSYSFRPDIGTTCLECQRINPTVYDALPLVEAVEAFRVNLRRSAQATLRRLGKREQAQAEADAKRGECLQGWGVTDPATWDADASRVSHQGIRLAQDLVNKGIRWGLSAAQQALLRKLYDESLWAAEARGTLTPGRQVVEGELVSVRGVTNAYGFRKRGTVKVQTEDGVVVVHLTIPQDCWQDWAKGDTVGVTVTIEVDADDPSVGFGKRPAKPFRTATR